MKCTSAEANKLLNNLNMEHEMLLEKERDAFLFTAATCENLEDARPEYDYERTKAELLELEEKIIRIKHAINLFNVSHEIPGFGITIDQALVLMPQLTNMKNRLANMCRYPAKKRIVSCSGSDLIEYQYANYDLEKAEQDFKAVVSRLAKLQNALDIENSTVKFELEID